MRNRGLYILIFALILFVGCNSTKEVTKQKVNVNKELSESKEQQYYYVFLEANRKKLLGDLNGALALFYQCLELNPKSAAAMSEISNINEIIQNYETALKYAKSAVDLEPENKWYNINLAKLYILQKEFNNAALIYEQLAKLDQSDVDIKYNLALLYTQTNQLQKAIDVYNQMEEIVGINEAISLRKQQLYIQLGQKSKAYAEIEELVKFYPENPRYYGILAEMYTNDNLFTKAEEYYNQLFQIDSTNAIGQLSIIDFYRKKMDYDNAFNMIKKVIYNDNIEYNQKVLIFVSMLNNQSEFNIYQLRIKEHLDLFKSEYPDEKDSYTLLADYYVKSNNYNEAQTVLEHITESFSTNYVIWEQLLSIYSYNNDFENMFKKSISAIDSFPNHTLFYLFNGVSANQIGKYTEAVKVLKSGLNTLENSSETEVDFYSNLADAYYNLKDYKQSDNYFELAIKKDPANLYNKNNYSYYLSERNENLEYAESLSKQTIQAEPNNSTFLDTYAWILYKLGRYQDALFYIKAAIENGGMDSEVIVEHYGDILYKVGEKERAVELWKLSKEMGNSNDKLQQKIETKSLIE